MTQKPISILVATDDRGCAWLAALMISIGENTKSPVCLYVFEKGLSAENQKKLTQTATQAQMQIKFVEITTNFDSFDSKRLPVQTLFRLSADTILSHLDKVLYLDIDILTYQDLKPLWDIDIGDNYLAGCYDLNINRDLGRKLDPQKKIKTYFNSGVLLMNLKAMRRDHIGQKCLELFKKYHNLLPSLDQDVLNVVCAQKIKPLPICWNWYVSLHRRRHKNLVKIYGPYLSDTPAIIHFYTQDKPHRLYLRIRHPIITYRVWKQKQYFWKCLKKTPYTLPLEIKVKF